MVPNIEEDDNLLLGIVFYIRNIILLGSTTTKHCSCGLLGCLSRLDLGVQKEVQRLVLEA